MPKLEENNDGIPNTPDSKTEDTATSGNDAEKDTSTENAITAYRKIREDNISELTEKVIAKIDEECNMYKSIFYNGRLTAGVLYLEADRMPKAEKLALLMDVFETKELYINGKKQTVYVD